jgi:hypothetical protein
MAEVPERGRGMTTTTQTHRLVLFKWLTQGDKEVLSITEHPFNNLESAVKFLDTVAKEDYEIAKVFLGDSLMHVRDQKNKNHDQNFS